MFSRFRCHSVYLSNIYSRIAAHQYQEFLSLLSKSKNLLLQINDVCFKDPYLVSQKLSSDPQFFSKVSRDLEDHFKPLIRILDKNISSNIESFHLISKRFFDLEDLLYSVLVELRDMNKRVGSDDKVTYDPTNSKGNWNLGQSCQVGHNIRHMIGLIDQIVDLLL